MARQGPAKPRRTLAAALLGVAVVLGGPVAAATPARTSTPTRITPPATQPHAATPVPAGTYYFNWYDKASPGMTNDNIHVAATSAPVNVTVALGGLTQTGSIQAGGEALYNFPQGTIGGPVVVTVTGGPAVVSQRVTYFRSFSEIPALTSADTDFWFTWYDNASPGMTNDNIHIVNPISGSPAATVTAKLISSGTTISTTVGANAEAMLKFPAGTIGGPIEVTSTQPVIVSQRVQYKQSFDEIAGVPATRAAQKLYFNWYDNLSQGFTQDNVHVVNTDPANPTIVTLSFTGHSDVVLNLNPGAESVYSYATTIGGALTLTSSATKVVASQRYVYYDGFKEVAAFSDADATQDQWFNWYDNASPCMPADNIHVLGLGPIAATGTVTLPGAATLSFSVNPGEEKILDFPNGSIGGPVHMLASGGKFVAEQRVVICAPPPPPPPAPVRKIVVSISQQHLWAYENGRLVMETDVTTGRPELPTPTGDYHIFFKQSPYEMISPWPPWSPYYYNSAWVQYVLEFLQGGYFLHDAPWRSWFGPGSQYGDGTHGCVNIPGGAGWGPIYFLWNWAQIGDEVLVQS